MYKIIAISGSLRKESFNTKVLKEAIRLAPEGLTIEQVDIHEIPVYNQDIQDPLPAPVEQLKEKIEKADGVLFVSPEYNYSIPGVLKNVLDWGSRPYGRNSWNGKIAGLIGVTDGSFGTARMYYDTVKILYGLHMLVVPCEVPIAKIQEKLDENNTLTDEKTVEKIQQLLSLMSDWITRFK